MTVNPAGGGARSIVNVLVLFTLTLVTVTNFIEIDCCTAVIKSSATAAKYLNLTPKYYLKILFSLDVSIVTKIKTNAQDRNMQTELYQLNDSPTCDSSPRTRNAVSGFHTSTAELLRFFLSGF